MDYVDVTIVGTVMMCFGFFVGIIISANKPNKDENEQELEHYGYGKPKDKSDEMLDDLFARDAAFIVEKFMPLVDSEIAGPNSFVFSREKKVANAKSCALIAMELMEHEFAGYGTTKENGIRLINVKKAIEQYK